MRVGIRSDIFRNGLEDLQALFSDYVEDIDDVPH